MLIVYFVAIGILIGYISGGHLANLGNRSLHWKWLAICSFLIQIVLFSDIPFLKLEASVIMGFHLLSYLGLLAFIFFNRKTVGIVITGIGIFLNSLVIFINGGYMPTLSENISKTSMARNAEALSQGEAVHNSIQTGKDTLLPWLGDIFYLPSWVPFSNVFSIGDVIIAAGIFLYLVLGMRPVKNTG